MLHKTPRIIHYGPTLPEDIVRPSLVRSRRLDIWHDGIYIGAVWVNEITHDVTFYHVAEKVKVEEETK